MVWKILGFVALFVILLGASSFWIESRVPRIGYIVINEVYEQFDLKKDLQRQFLQTRTEKKRLLDSLRVDISVLNGRLETKREQKAEQLLEKKKGEYHQLLQRFTEEEQKLTRELDEKIIKQLNQYISDFGRAENFDIILGNTSDGSIMYGVDKLNLTTKVILFINDRYKGVK